MGTNMLNKPKKYNSLMLLNFRPDLFFFITTSLGIVGQLWNLGIPSILGFTLIMYLFQC